MLEELNDKNADVKKLAERAIRDETFRKNVLDGLDVKNETYRYNCHKILCTVCETHVGILYPYWDTLAAHLSSSNSYRRISAVHLIACLASVDEEHRFEGMFDLFYDLLDDRSMVVSFYVAKYSGFIAGTRPDLQREITRRLLSIDNTSHAPGRKELVKAGIIEAFSEYYEECKTKRK